jgi:hypothetical protein
MVASSSTLQQIFLSKLLSLKRLDILLNQLTFGICRRKSISRHPKSKTALEYNNSLENLGRPSPSGWFRLKSGTTNSYTGSCRFQSQRLPNGILPREMQLKRSQDIEIWKGHIRDPKSCTGNRPTQLAAQ